MCQDLPEEMLYPRNHGGLSADLPQTASRIGVWNLLGHSILPDDELSGAFAWVIAAHCNPGCEIFVPALGMGKAAFVRLLTDRFPHFTAPPAWLAAQGATPENMGVLGEFDDLLQLLLDHAGHADEHHRQIAHLVATACMGNDHLWQDLGLPNRNSLSILLSAHFPQLAAKNTGDMKWKKFLYKQLCDRAGVLICKSPSCGICCDYDKCFGPES